MCLRIVWCVVCHKLGVVFSCLRLVLVVGVLRLFTGLMRIVVMWGFLGLDLVLWLVVVMVL